MTRILVILIVLGLLLSYAATDSTMAIVALVVTLAVAALLWTLKHFLTSPGALGTLLVPESNTAFAQGAPTGHNGEVLISYLTYAKLRKRLVGGISVILVALFLTLVGLRALPVPTLLLFVPLISVIAASVGFAVMSLISLVPAGSRLQTLGTLLATDPRAAFASYAPTENTGALKVGYTTYKRLYKATLAALVVLLLVVGAGLGREVYLARQTSEQNIAAAVKQFNVVADVLMSGQGDLKTELQKLAAQSLQPAPTVDEDSLTQRLLTRVTEQLPEPPEQIIRENTETQVIERTVVQENTLNTIQLEQGSSFAIKNPNGVTFASFSSDRTITFASGSAFNIAGTWHLDGVRVIATAEELNELRQGVDTNDPSRGDASELHHHDGRYYTETQLSSTTQSSEGSRLIGTRAANFTNFTPVRSDVEAALAAIDTAIGNAGSGSSANLTAGSVVFASSTGAFTQDNANFFWDDTTNRLGIGTSTPSNALEIRGHLELDETITNASIRFANQTLTYDGDTIARYGLTLVSDSGMGGDGAPALHYSAYGGMRFSTGYGSVFAEAPRLTIMGGTPAGTTDGFVGIGETAPLAQLEVQSSYAGAKGLIVQGAASQTANLQEWQNSSGTALASLNADGSVLTLPSAFAIGAGSHGTLGNNAVVVGNGAGATGDVALSIGYLARASDANTVSIGNQAFASGNAAIGIGTLATGSGASSVAIGTGATASSSNAIALGTSASASVGRSIAIGDRAVAAFDQTVAIGLFATPTAANQFVVGGQDFAYSDVFFGEGVLSTSPSAYTIHGTGGSGSNVAGAALKLAGGKGTGSGVGGDIVFQFAAAGSSGSSLNSLATACSISGTTGALSCPGAGVNSERFGSGATAAGETGVAVGYNAEATGFQSVAVGAEVTANIRDTLIGYGAASSDPAGFGTAVGFLANTGFSGVALGQSTTAAYQSIAIGTASTNAGFRNSIALGLLATNTAINQLVIGGSAATSLPITSGYFGSGVVDTAPASFTLNATGGSGSNVAGAALQLAGGKGTGNAAGGSIIFQTSDAGSSGSTLQSLTTKMTILASGNVGIGTTAPYAKLANVSSQITDGGIGVSSSGIQWSLNDGGYAAGIVNTNTSALSHGLLLRAEGSGVALAVQGPSNATAMTVFSNGNVGIGTGSFGTNATKVLAIGNGTAPTTSIADGVQLYAEDVAASSELKVRDEAGNITTLSPHNYSLFAPSEDYLLPWSFYSRNDNIGREINVDMYGAIAAIEQMAGKQFIYAKDTRTGEELQSTVLTDNTLVEASVDSQVAGSATETPNATPITFNIETELTELLKAKPELLMQALNIQNIALSITELRSLTIQETLVVEGNTNILGDLTIGGDVAVGGELSVSGQQGGYAVVPQGSTQVEVRFAIPLSTKPIVNATLEDGFALFATANVSKEGFTIRLEKAAAHDFTFAWTALTSNNPTTTRGATAEQPAVDILVEDSESDTTDVTSSDTQPAAELPVSEPAPEDDTPISSDSASVVGDTTTPDQTFRGNE